MLARITRSAINSRAVFFIRLESFHFVVGGSLALILALLGVEGVGNGEHQSAGVGIRVFVEAYVLDVHPPALVAGVEDVLQHIAEDGLVVFLAVKREPLLVVLFCLAIFQ